MFKIYTSVVNRPKFIEYQKKTFDKFLQHKYEFYVFDDSTDINLTKEIQKVCETNNIFYEKTPNNIDHSSCMAACGGVTQWFYDKHIKNTKDKILIADSDIFIYDYLNVEKFLEGHAMAMVPQSREYIWYPWIGLLFLDMDQIPDKNLKFSGGLVRGIMCDVGGPVYELMQSFPDLSIKNIFHTSHINSERKNLNHLPELVRASYKDFFCFETMMGKFIHYGSATNWKYNFRSSLDPTKEKTDYLYYFLDVMMSTK